MKVLFSQNIDGIAGSERYFLALIPSLISQGINVEICCIIKKSAKISALPFLELLKEKNIPFHIVECRSYGSPLIPFKINRIVKKIKADIIHSHLIYADVWSAIVKRFLNKKITIISTKHGYHESTYVKYCLTPEKIPHNLYYYLFKFSHNKMDSSYACSYGLADFYCTAGLTMDKKMQVIQHGFDYPEISINDHSQYRFSMHQLIITGRLIERKGHHFILEIMPNLISLFPDIILIVLGTGELEQNLKQKVKDLEIDDHIKFMGFQSDVNQFLINSDIMLVTSYSEGLPLVIFESFNAKIPVITFNTIGSNELIENNETGIVVPAFDTRILQEEISHLLANPVKRSKLASAAFENLKTKYSLKRMTQDTIAFYKAALPK